MHPAPGSLLTDLYQLTMLQAYYDRGMNRTAVFEFFIRKLPPERNFLMAAGLEQTLEFLETLQFTRDEIDWLKDTGKFKPEFLDSLSALRFTGDVDAMAEGTIFFPEEPILRVTAPMPEAQLVETRLINLLHYQTMIASKAARIRLAAPDQKLIDFGLRRAHGAEAGLLAARASYIAGMDGSATVASDRQFGIPSFGTMAHSFVQAHDDEAEAFLNFARSQPENVVLLLDTYNVADAVKKLPELARVLAAEGIEIKGVRLDSGDMLEQSRMVRNFMDRNQLSKVMIFASGNLDEGAIARLVREEAPIDAFGIGTHLTTSSDAPNLDCAYKLQEYDGKARRKRSEGKATWPGRKQVFRRLDRENQMAGDVLTLQDHAEEGLPLLEPVMKGGKRLRPETSLKKIRERSAGELRRLPAKLRSLDPAPPYSVRISDSLRDLAQKIDSAR